MDRIVSQSGDQAIVEFCKTHECRKNTYFKLKKKDGSYVEFVSEIDPPVVQPSFISIYPGETLFIEGDVEGDRLTNLKNVKTIEHPKKTITLCFWQERGMADGTGMLLKVAHPFDRPLRYRLDMMPLGWDCLKYTSSCPVHPGIMSYEHWPFPIFQLLLSDFRFVEGEEARLCK